jgi:SulP family sulfate permease
MNQDSVPKGIEIFVISESASMEVLYPYLEIVHTMAIRPKILIIRFQQISNIDSVGANVLNEIIRWTSVNNIGIIFSDVGITLKDQLENYFLPYQIGEENIFSNIDNAISRATKLMERVQDKLLQKRFDR